MSLEGNIIIRMFNDSGFLEKWLSRKAVFDVLSGEDRESMINSLVNLESVTSYLLAYIAIKTKNEETLMKALNHPKVLVDL